MTDAEKVHRWLTEAELDAMLEDAWHRGAAAMKRDAYEKVEISSSLAADMIAETPAPKYEPDRDDRARLDGAKWWHR